MKEVPTLINFAFFVREDFWYVVFILDTADSSVCNTSIFMQNVSSIKRQFYEKFKIL